MWKELWRVEQTDGSRAEPRDNVKALKLVDLRGIYLDVQKVGRKAESLVVERVESLAEKKVDEKVWKSDKKMAAKWDAEKVAHWVLTMVVRWVRLTV